MLLLLPPSIPLTCLPVLQPQQQLNSPCVAAWWGSSCLWPLYAKRGISHQLASTDTPAVWGRLMPTRDTLLFSPSLSLFLSLSLSVSLSLSASPTGHTINCLLRVSLLSFHCVIPPSLFLLPEWQMWWRGARYGVERWRWGDLSVCLCRWVWMGGAVQDPCFWPWQAPPILGLPFPASTHTRLSSFSRSYCTNLRTYWIDVVFLIYIMWIACDLLYSLHHLYSIFITFSMKSG